MLAWDIFTAGVFYAARGAAVVFGDAAPYVGWPLVLIGLVLLLCRGLRWFACAFPITAAILVCVGLYGCWRGNPEYDRMVEAEDAHLRAEVAGLPYADRWNRATLPVRVANDSDVAAKDYEVVCSVRAWPEGREFWLEMTYTEDRDEPVIPPHGSRVVGFDMYASTKVAGHIERGDRVQWCRAGSGLDAIMAQIGKTHLDFYGQQDRVNWPEGDAPETWYR